MLLLPHLQMQVWVVPLRLCHVAHSVKQVESLQQDATARKHTW